MTKSEIFIKTVGCHAAGEVGEVIVSCVENPKGKTITEKSEFLMKNPKLRNLLFSEPRGEFSNIIIALPAINKSRFC